MMADSVHFTSVILYNTLSSLSCMDKLLLYFKLICEGVEGLQEREC